MSSFGGFSIAVRGAPLRLHQPRLQQLLAYLLLYRQQPQSRRHIAFTFWPDSNEKQALPNLRKQLHRLGQLLPELPRFLEVTTTTLQWRRDAPAQVDVIEFEQYHALGREDWQGVGIEDLEKAIGLYRDDLLPQFYEEWLNGPRQQLHQHHVAALTALAKRYEERRDYRTALNWTRRLLQRSPLQEAVYRRLIRLHLLLSDRAAALQAYHQCATQLAEELGVEPGPDTKELHQRALQDIKLDSVLNIQDESDRLPLAGRINEWRQLQQSWERAQAGLSSLVLVQGEAGIGKTRLVEELVDSTQRLGHRTVQTRAYAAGDSGAFAPIVDLLRSPPVSESLQTLDEVWLVELSRLLPELKTDQPDLPDPFPMEAQWQQHRFHEAIARSLLTSPRPLLLHFDDIQWCDAASIACLQFLLEFDATARLLLVGTVRNDEIEPTHPILRLHQQLRRHNRSLSIELQPLSLEAIAQLINSAIGYYPEPTVTNALFAESAGNALFALELMRSGQFSAESGLTDSPPGPTSNRRQLPEKIDAVIRWRLDQLSATSRDLAATAADIGHDFTQNSLQRASAKSENEVVLSLDELWQSRIIREQGEGNYDFSHDYIREVSVGLVSPIQRRHLHHRVAKALQSEPESSSINYNARIANHFMQAGMATEARPYIEWAGDVAASRYADEEALVLYEQALSSWPADEVAARFRLHSKREMIYSKLIVADEWSNELERMATVAADLMLNDPANVAPSVETAIRHSRYERFFLQRVDMARLEKALNIAQAQNKRALEVRVLIAIGHEYNPGDLDLSAHYLGQAIQLAEANQIDAEAADAYEKIAPSFLFRGSPETEVKTYLRKALAYAEHTGDRRRQAIGHDKLGYLAFYHGEAAPDQSITAISRALELAQATGDAEYEVIFAGNLGRAATLAGQYELAQQNFDLARQRSQHNSFSGWRERNRGHHSYLLSEIGDYEGARQQFSVSVKALAEGKSLSSAGTLSNDFGWL